MQTTMIMKKEDLHNALNDYIKKEINKNAKLKDYKISNLKGKEKGNYLVELDIDITQEYESTERI